MIPWIQLDSATVPDGGELRLMQRGDEFSIMAGSIELMNSRVSGSEQALATLALERIKFQRAPRVLIGGLGMGFTLRAAMAARADAEIVVAEIVPAIVQWARGPLAPVFAQCLDDPKVSVVLEDVSATIKARKGAFDAILLDVDNGPEGLTRNRNEAIYSHVGLRAAYNSLRPGGVLAVWSAHPSPAFTQRLGKAGFAVDEVKVRGRGSKGGSRHLIWMAAKSSLVS